MATTDQLRKAERRSHNPLPPLNSYTRDGWIEVIRAMDEVRFGKPTQIITWRMTKANLQAVVARRMAAGEALPRASWHHGEATNGN